MSYYEIDVSMLLDSEKKVLYDALQKASFIFDEVDIGWHVSLFHFLPETDKPIDALRKEYFIPERCPVRPYFHP